ncbi:MAG: choice-of-anchor D domain-containing protein, partial [Calditrichaeota bacterium]|nr:choice-of-anchor D domain-containing protein [Calditrichota bacterium]
MVRVSNVCLLVLFCFTATSLLIASNKPKENNSSSSDSSLQFISRDMKLLDNRSETILYTSQNYSPPNRDLTFPRRDEDFIVYEYGFEDDWDGWETADLNNAGDFWEISDDDAHDGDFSAHCPIEENLRNCLISPPLDIPEEGWNTWFDFWIHADTRVWDSDDDGFLDDYFKVEVRPEQGGWQDVIYDYGRDDEWLDNWIHYEPNVWFREDLPEWRRKLDLSQFAGQRIHLRWQVITDDDMDGDQGTGIWIDDFRLLASDSPENDVGMEWLHVGYPVSVGFRTDCSVSVKNYGRVTQERIRKFFQIDDGRYTPIMPWQDDLESGESSVYHFRPEATNVGIGMVKAWTWIEDDENQRNDTAKVEFMMYPEGLWKLGYDDRRWTEEIRFDENNGPAVLFTPEDDNIDDSFDLVAIDVRWSDDEQVEAVTTTLTIFDDDRDGLGAELYSEEIEVTPDDLHPEIHHIDLPEVDALLDMNDDFWVYFEIDNDDQFPRPLGRLIDDDEPNWGEGHYFMSNGNEVDEREIEFQIHAIISGEDFDERNIEARQELDFGEVDVNRGKTYELRVLGASREPVTIEEVEVDDDHFSVEFAGELPVELTLGEIARFEVTFTPDDVDEFTASLTFDCDDESPPEVSLIGSGAHLPNIEIEPDILDFGAVAVDDEEVLELLIWNSGGSDLTISNISVHGFYFSVEFDNEFDIEPDGDAPVFVTFSPEERGSVEGFITISSNDPYEPQISVILIGMCDCPPEIVNLIEDIELEEDFEPIILADLDTIFFDPDDEELFFSAEANNENLSFDISDDNLLTLT